MYMVVSGLPWWRMWEYGTVPGYVKSVDVDERDLDPGERRGGTP